MIQGVDWLGSVNTGYQLQGFKDEGLFMSASTISRFISDFTPRRSDIKVAVEGLVNMDKAPGQFGLECRECPYTYRAPASQVKWLGN